MAPLSTLSRTGPLGLVTAGLGPHPDTHGATAPEHTASASASPVATAGQTSAASTYTSSPLRRKPAPLQLISSSVRGGSIERLPSIKRYSRRDGRRPSSVDSPKLPPNNQGTLQSNPTGFDTSSAPRDLDSPHGPIPPVKSRRRNASLDSSRIFPSQPSQELVPPSGRKNSILRPDVISAQQSSQNTVLSYSASEYEDEPRYSHHSRSTTMTEFAPNTPYAPASPQLTLQVNGTPTLPSNHHSTAEQASMSKSPKSPSTKISSFFGWKASQPQPGNASPTTTFSDRSMSPPRSPLRNETTPGDNRSSSSSVNADNKYTEYFLPASPSAALTTAPGSTTQVDELLRELREVSSELAASIGREMELEDEVERYHNEVPAVPLEPSRRTSDYYSDSGTSQVRYPLADSETKMQGLEKMRRKAEQEKAQLRWEMSQKVQDNIIDRKALELHVQSLEEQLQARAVDQPSEKERELEKTLEDVRRRLNDEKQFKENFEDLLSGMRQEIESHQNERDNLRDEVVPQLRARVEGLEADAVEMQKLTYENTRMQLELQNLKNENQALLNARKLQIEHQQGARFKSIQEDEDSPVSPQLARSNSLARSRSIKNRSGSLSSKSNSPGQGNVDVTPQTVKEVEDQRDALHTTIKHMLMRQDHLQKTHTKQLRALQKERDDALNTRARRVGFNVEVRKLRSEIDNLRQRADEAMEQKWQCEKGLGGLKMDLDRAKQETSSLRELLKEHDIFVPDSISAITDENSQDSLEKAYEDLRVTHSDSMSRIRSGTITSSRRPASLEAAEARMEALSLQVQQQVRSNNELRERLAEAIGRGEKEQDASAKKITELQKKLKTVEDQLVAAQQHSEDSIAEHEDHVKEMSDSQMAQSKRGITRSWTTLGLTAGNPKSPLFDAKSPKLGKTTTGLGISVADASKTAALEQKVKDLEATAVQAENEMQGVVERMNRAQIEVAELQMERDEAMRQTRRLQREIGEESIRAKALAT